MNKITGLGNPWNSCGPRSTLEAKARHEDDDEKFEHVRFLSTVSARLTSVPVSGVRILLARNGGRYNRLVLLRTDRAARACYRTDGGQIVYGLPDSVVHARCPEDVADVLRLAQRDRIPVTCRGGGLTTEGESVAARGILLDLKGMNRLLDCDGDTAWVEAGMTWHQVAEALRPRGLDYTSAPLNMLSTVGGTLGVGGIDVNSPRHGCAADQAVELEVVTPTGEIVRVKEGDDYLERVLLGYGQFGVITKARIKVRPYRPMTVRHFLYTDVGVALADMMRLVEQDAVDACAILTLRDDVVALILGFEGEPEGLPAAGTRPSRWIVATIACALRACVRGAGAMPAS